MSTGRDEGAAWREQLSALADGELDDAAPVCAGWREERVRATWHCYQLIGDVLRSDDLAGSPTRDATLLRRVREGLAREPVVLAPEPLLPAAGAAERRHGWRAAGAIAAGFVAVAGVYTFMRPAAEPPPLLAGASAMPTLVAETDPAGFLGGSQMMPVLLDPTPRLVRDPRLDAYLAAHKQFAGSSSIPMPLVYLRSASPEAALPGR